jgi:hypothetical protein
MRSSINTGPIKVYSTDSETQVKRLYQRPRAFMEYFIPRRHTYATKLLDTTELAQTIQLSAIPIDRLTNSTSVELPKLVVAFDKATRWQYEFGYTRQNRAFKVCVFDKDSPRAIGWLGYDDWTNDGDGDDVYGMYSPNCMNRRYGEGYRTHMATSRNIDTLVKKAAESIRPSTPAQLVGFDIATYAKGWRDSVRMVESTESDLKWKVKNHEDLMSELCMVADSAERGTPVYRFCSPTLRQDIEAWAAHKAEQSALEKKQTLSYVRFVSEERVIVARITSMDNDAWQYGVDYAYATTPDDLPEEIMQGMAVLNMMPDAEHVPYVGTRISESKTYYVIHE